MIFETRKLFCKRVKVIFEFFYVRKFISEAGSVGVRESETETETETETIKFIELI